MAGSRTPVRTKFAYGALGGLWTRAAKSVKTIVCESPKEVLNLRRILSNAANETARAIRRLCHTSFSESFRPASNQSRVGLAARKQSTVRQVKLLLPQLQTPALVLRASLDGLFGACRNRRIRLCKAQRRPAEKRRNRFLVPRHPNVVQLCSLTLSSPPRPPCH